MKLTTMTDKQRIRRLMYVARHEAEGLFLVAVCTFFWTFIFLITFF